MVRAGGRRGAPSDLHPGGESGRSRGRPQAGERRSPSHRAGGGGRHRVCFCSLSGLGLRGDMESTPRWPSLFSRNGSSAFSNKARNSHMRQLLVLRFYFSGKGLSLPREQTTFCKTAICSSSSCRQNCCIISKLLTEQQLAEKDIHTHDTMGGGEKP